VVLGGQENDKSQNNLDALNLCLINHFLCSVESQDTAAGSREESSEAYTNKIE
jgi:hypothetical protein